MLPRYTVDHASFGVDRIANFKPYEIEDAEFLSQNLKV